MPSHDMVLDDAPGVSVRADINHALLALVSSSSGPDEPAPAYAYQFWADTGNGVLKQRNAGNSAWVVRGPLAETLVVSRDANVQLGVGDWGRRIIATGSWTQTLVAAATLGDGWAVEFKNAGTGVITIDPNGAETIDGVATIQLAPGESCFILCDGSAFFTIGRTASDIQRQIATAFTSAGAAPAFTLTPVPGLTAYAAGQRFRVKFNADGNGSDTLNVSGLGAKSIKQYDSTGAKIAAVIAVGQLADLEYDGADFVVLDPLPPASQKQFQSVGSSVAANALTLTLAPTSLYFRSATLADGVPVSRTVGSQLSLSVPSGATLGTVSGQSARLVLLALDVAGTVELAVVNLAGGVNLDETTLISTTAISVASTSASTVYSTTARSNVAFRVVGFIDIAEAVAGVWASDATCKQGAGGLATSGWNSLGFGQAWQDVTASRAAGTTYYNTTGRSIWVSIYNDTGTSGNFFFKVNGLSVTKPAYQGTYGPAGVVQALIPVGASYSMQAGFPFVKWFELR